MGFREAVRTCLRDKYVTFSGRAPRSEYWYFMLFFLLVFFCLGILIALFGGFGSVAAGGLRGLFSGGSGVVAVIGVFFFIATFLPVVSVTVRRFHDVNISGWWYLVCLVLGYVPYVGFLANITVLVIAVLKGSTGDNKFGSDPLMKQHAADVFA